MGRGRSKAILVIGGGVSGLIAGIELGRAGWQVTLLEARDRLGGRIYTVPGDSGPVELGAEFIHGGSEFLWKHIRAGGLRTTQVTELNRILVDGRLEPADLWSKANGVIQRIDPDAPDQSFSQFLRDEDLPEADKQLAAHFVQGFDAADTEKISARALRSSAWSSEESPGSQQFRIAGGYFQLIEHLAKELASFGAEVKKERIVSGIRWKPGEVQVVAEHQGRTEAFEARAAIVTLPLGVLKAGVVKFEPALQEKRAAIERLEFGNVMKLVLRFQDAFWPER